MNTNTIGIGRRLLSMLLAFVMVFGMLPTFAFAEEEHVHTWGEWTVSAAPTCTAQGQKVRSCADCGAAETTAISPNGHSWSDWTVTAYPYCIETGSRMHNCTVCGEVETETIPANGHTWSDWTVTVDPTCTEAGEKVRSCSACGTVETEAVPALGHSFGEWQITAEADCVNAGSKERICSVCNEKETEAIPALGHSFGDWQITAEPDCTNAGSKERICSACNEKETEAVPALGHSFGDWQTTAEPDCTNAGSKERICSVCGEKETEAIDALGHDWGEWEIVTEATCNEDGEKIHTCSVCEVTETEVIPAAHKWGEWEIVTEATCTEEGEQVRVCEACEETETEKIPALGHKWDVEDEDEESTCTVCGEHREAKYNIIVDGQRWHKVYEEDGNVETAEDWAAMFYSYYPTGDWAKDLLTIASSQLGYKGVTLENKDGLVVNYSRYGHWYGMPFGSWCAMFVSFCLHYAQVPTSAMPIAASCESWVSSLSGSGKYASAGTYSPKPGDLVFFDYFPYDNIADHVGIVNSFNEENGLLVTIEGATNNIVKIHRYNISDRDILGFGIMPENPALIVAEPEIITETIEREQRTISATANGQLFEVSGVLPVDATLQVVVIPLESAQKIYETQTGNSEGIITVVDAYDITILSGGERYDLEAFDETVSVKIGIADIATPVDILHVKIDVADENGVIDAGQLQIAEDTVLETETVAKGAEGSEVFFDLDSLSVVLRITRAHEDWPRELEDLADSYYDPVTGTVNPVNPILTAGPSGESDANGNFKAGDIVTYDLTCGLSTALNWPGDPYYQTSSLYDVYKNVKLEVTLPAGLILKKTGENYTITATPNDNDLSVSHKYTIAIPDTFPADNGEPLSFNFEVFIGNNGTANAINSYGVDDGNGNLILPGMVKLSADFDLLNKLLQPGDDGYVVKTYHRETVIDGSGFSTYSPDVWGVVKDQKGNPVVSAATASQPTVTYTWEVGVGLGATFDEDGKPTSLIQDVSKYSRFGADEVTSITLDESLSAVFSAGSYGRTPISVSIKRNGEGTQTVTYNDTDTISNIKIWGNGADERLKMLSGKYLDSDGIVSPGDDDKFDVETPVYTVYTVTAVYPYDNSMTGEFYETEANKLTATNTAKTKAQLAKKGLQECTSAKPIEASLPFKKPAKLTIAKYLNRYNGSQANYKNLNKLYGNITYTLAKADETSFTAYTYANSTYTPVGPATSLTVSADTTYYLLPGDYTLKENIDPAYANDMEFVSVSAGTESSENNIQFSVERNELRTVNFVNREKRGTITIYKTDDKAVNPTPLKNAEFQLKDASGTVIRTIKTGDNGYGYFGLLNDPDNPPLPYGTYRVEETKAPVGYTMGETTYWDVTIGEGEGQQQNVSITVKNVLTKATIHLTKKSGRNQADPTTFPKVTNNNYPASFVLERSLDGTNWETVKTDINGTRIGDENTGSFTLTGGEISLDVPAKTESGVTYQYRFVETINKETSGDYNGRYRYYPVVETATGFVNRPDDHTANSKTVELTPGDTKDVYMYNREFLRVRVTKSFYQYNSDGQLKDVTGQNDTAEFALYAYYGDYDSESDISESSLLANQYVDELLGGTQTAGKVNNSTKYATWFVPSYSGAGKVTYFLREVSGKPGFVWSAESSSIGTVVTIGEHKYLRVDFSTTGLNYTSTERNDEDVVAVQLNKRNADATNQGVPLCQVTIYEDAALTKVATNAKDKNKQEAEREKYENVELPRDGSSKTFFLEGNKTYYYKETYTNPDYVFDSLTTDVTGADGTVTKETTTTNLGVINLVGKNPPVGVQGTYTTYNKPLPEVTITKKTMGRQIDLTGAKFTVYVKDDSGQYVEYKNAIGRSIVFDLSDSSTASRSLPNGTYYIAETTVPDDYLNPNSANTAAEYNRVAGNYHRKLVGDTEITYTYDSNTGLTFTEITVDDDTRSFTFYNIYIYEKVEIKKRVDGEFAPIDGFMVYIYNGDQQVGEGVQTVNGIARFDKLPMYDNNGNRILYTVKEGEPSTWSASPIVLKDKYYKVADGQQFKLDVQPASDVYNTTDKDGKTLTVDNATYIRIYADKVSEDGWAATHGGAIPQPMKDATIGLYRRTESSETPNPNPWVYQDKLDTDEGGNVSFGNIERGYEYALVELASNSSVYYPYQNGFKGTPAKSGDRYENLYEDGITGHKQLSDCNYLLVTGITTDKTEYNAGRLFNRSHWVQFDITKYKDGSSKSDNIVARNAAIAAGEEPQADENGHAYNVDSNDTPLDNCVFSLYRCEVGDTQDTVTFDRESWTLINTYTSGTLYENQGTENERHVPGEFLTDVDEGANKNYVYVLVEENVGPNSVEINPHFEYLAWYCDEHCSVTVVVPNQYGARTSTYTLDVIKEDKGLNSWEPKIGPGGNILLAALRLAKWQDSYVNGVRQEIYTPLNNVSFELRLADGKGTDGKGTVLSNMTSGLDGNNVYSSAQSGTYQLIIDTTGATPTYTLREYEVASDTQDHKDYDVTAITDTLSTIDGQYTIYGVRVDVYETDAPDGYGYASKVYQTYLCFCDLAPGSTAEETFTFFSDLYLVKTADNQYGLAESQSGRLWYITNQDNESQHYPSGSAPLRIVDYPMTNTSVLIHKVGYTPVSATMDHNGSPLDSEAIALGNYGAAPLSGVTMALERKNESGGWGSWDAANDKWSPSGVQYTFVTEDGSFFFPNGLPAGEYRIYETDLGSAENKTKYEMAYPGGEGANARYRVFTVSDESTTIYMANPEKIDLVIQKTDMVNHNPVEGMTYKLSGIQAPAVENPAGTYTFSNIPTGTYILTETGPSGISTKDFVTWFQTEYPSLVALVGNGMKLGYTYETASVTNGTDIVISAATPWDQTNSRILELDIENPFKTNILLKKVAMDDNTGLTGAEFEMFYLPFSAISGQISVSLPTIADGKDLGDNPNPAANTVRGIFKAAGWTDVGSYTVDSEDGKLFTNQEPGIYAFYESKAPDGYDRLVVGGNVVIYSAVVTGGMPVSATVIPVSVTVDGSPVTTGFASVDGTQVTVTAKDPRRATLKAMKIVDAGDLDEADIGNWSVTLNLYDKASDGTKVGSVTIKKGDDLSEPVTFMNGSNTAYFSVDKTYYLEEVVNKVNSTYADAAHFVIVSVLADGTPVTLPTGEKRYPIEVGSVDGLTITVQNRYLYGKVTFAKRDADDLDAKLPGAKFEVRHYDAEEDKWIKINGSSVTEIKVNDSGTGDYVAIVPLDSANPTDYRIYETKAPNNYVMNPDPDMTYVQVKLPTESGSNVVDFSLSKTIHETITNTTGKKIIIEKYSNIYASGTTVPAEENHAQFSIYHLDKSVTPHVWKYAVDNNGTTMRNISINVYGKIEFLMTPGETYAVAESWVNSNYYTGLDGFYVDNVKKDLEQISVNDENVYVVRFTDVSDEITLKAYNIPLVNPIIRKLDVGQYPNGTYPTATVKIYEVPENFEETKAAVEAFLGTDPAPTPIKTLDTNTTFIDEDTGYLGTKVTWTSTAQDGSDQWNPTKNYLIVETLVGRSSESTGTGAYDTMVKEDPRVTWFLKTPKVATPDKNNPPVYTLENINGVAGVTLTKEVIEKSDTFTDSDVVNGQVGTLFADNRKVAYTLTPVVTGKNQMLTSFVLKDEGLEPSPEGAPFSYSINEIRIGKAGQNVSVLETNGSINAKILAKVYLDGSDVPYGSPVNVTADDQENPSGTVTVGLPAGTQSVYVEYYSEEVIDNTDPFEMVVDKATGEKITADYVLGEQFKVAPTVVLMTVNKTAESEQSPGTEITKFENTSKASLAYPKWGADGSTPVKTPVDSTATADVDVEPVKLPIVSVTKSSDADDDGIAPIGGIVQYKLTFTNSSASEADFVNPVLLDILPTGVKLKRDEDTYPVEVTYPADQTMEILDVTPIEGDMVPHVNLVNQDDDYTDAETAVVFELKGRLKPGYSASVTFYAQVQESAAIYKVQGQDNIEIRNDVYLSSSAQSYHIKDKNKHGYSFAVALGTSGYTYGEDLNTAAANAVGDNYGVAQIHESGVEDYLGDYVNGDKYVWINQYNELTVLKGASLTKSKAVKGDRDAGYHEKGLGSASRTRIYPDDPRYDGEKVGCVDWRLTVTNGTRAEAEELTIGDVIPKVGEDSNRGTKWDVVFDEISVVMFNGAELLPSQNKYQVWYYDGPLSGAKAAMETAIPLARNEEALVNAGWKQTIPGSTEQQREAITAFIVVFDSSIKLDKSASAIVTYHTTVKAIPDDDYFNEHAAFQNADNNFAVYYKGYPIVDYSNPVSVTLLDGDVQIEGDVWIDEDWDGTQQDSISSVTGTYNRRKYSDYAIINALAENISFAITDNREASGQKKPENSEHGSNTNPGWGESIRHFRFLELGPAIAVEGRELYVNNKLNPLALKGDDSYNYSLTATIEQAGLLNIFKLTSLGSGHYMSDNPDTELYDSSAGKPTSNSLDNNFYVTSSDGTVNGTHPFYVRYSDLVDQSKDIGFKMYRELEILKVAMDTLNQETPMPIEGAQFEVYGYYEDSALKGDHVFGSGTLLTFIEKSVGEYEMIFNYNEATFDTSVLSEGEKVTTILTTGSDGKIHITGLNWWKEYDIKETSATDGFSIAGATATGDSSVGTEIVDHGDGKFTLKVPDKGKTNILDKVTVANPRGIPFEFEKIGEVNGSDTTVPLYGIEFSLFLDKDCTIPATDGVDENGQPKQIKAVSEKVTDEAGKDHAIVHFDMLRFAYGDPNDTENYFPGIYYMKETSLGTNTLYWDNSTIYKLDVKPQSGNIAPHVEVTVVEASTGTGNTGSTGGTGETGGTGNTGTSGTADDSGVTTTARTGTLSKSEVGFEYTILNELKKYRISLVKKDGKDNTTPIVGAEFDLYDKMPPANSSGSSGTSTGGDQDAKKVIPVEAKAVAEMKIPLDAKAITAVKLPADARADAAATRDGTEPVVPILTGLKTIEGGKLDLGVLVPGTYYLVETKSPPDYYKLNAPVKIVIAEEKDADGKVVKVNVTVTYKMLTLTIDANNNAVFEWKLTEDTYTADVPSGINTVPVELEPIEFNIYDYPKYGKLKIIKYLSSYKLNETATFKFLVTGTIKEKDETGKIVEKEVYNQVVVLTLSNTNTGSTIIDMIPAGAHIEVTEIYTGSHYELDPDAIQETVTTIVANETVSVNLTNRMRWEDIDGHGIVNIFEPDPNSSNGWKWTGKYYPSTPSALPPEPQTGGGTGGGDDGTGGSGGDSGGGSDGPAEGGGSQAAPAG